MTRLCISRIELGSASRIILAASSSILNWRPYLSIRWRRVSFDGLYLKCKDESFKIALRVRPNFDTNWNPKMHLYSPFQHRSEEHTSELQSRPHLVCRLLLE